MDRGYAKEVRSETDEFAVMDELNAVDVVTTLI